MADEPTTSATESEAEKSAASTPLPPVPTPNIDTGYTDAGVPTLDGVRDKIETRYGTALGATELAEETPGAHRGRTIRGPAQSCCREARRDPRFDAQAGLAGASFAEVS